MGSSRLVEYRPPEKYSKITLESIKSIQFARSLTYRNVVLSCILVFILNTNSEQQLPEKPTTRVVTPSADDALVLVVVVLMGVVLLLMMLLMMLLMILLMMLLM